jgi:hypothetical protein
MVFGMFHLIKAPNARLLGAQKVLRPTNRTPCVLASCSPSLFIIQLLRLLQQQVSFLLHPSQLNLSLLLSLL